MTCFLETYLGAASNHFAVGCQVIYRNEDRHGLVDAVDGCTGLPYAICPIYHKIDFFSKRLILIYKLRIVFIFLRNR
jgi:hypothetical protein